MNPFLHPDSCHCPQCVVYVQAGLITELRAEIARQDAEIGRLKAAALEFRTAYLQAVEHGVVRLLASFRPYIMRLDAALHSLDAALDERERPTTVLASVPHEHDSEGRY